MDEQVGITVTPKYLGIYERARAGRSPMSAIQANCLICMGCSTKEIRDCSVKDCVFYKYRPYQENPYRLHRRRTGRISDRYVRGQNGQILEKRTKQVSKDIIIQKPTTGPIRVRVTIEPKNDRS